MSIDPRGLTWVDVTNKFKPLLLMHNEFFKEIYENDDGIYIVFQAGDMYTEENVEGIPQTDLYTITWWTEAIQKYELFNARPSEAAKYLKANSRFIQYMAYRVMKGTFAYANT